MRGGDGTKSVALQDDTSVIVWGDFITGQVLGPLRSATGSVSNAVDGRATLSVEIDLSDWAKIQPTIQPWRHFLAWVTSGWVQAAGPLVAPPTWTPQGVTLTAAGAEDWLGRMEVMPPSQVAAQMVVPVTVKRGKRTTKVKNEWKPNPATRTSFTGRAPRAVAASLIDQLMGWGASRVPTLTHTFINVGEGGSLTIGWDGIDHEVTADAIADVLAGSEWRLDPYWIDGAAMILGWDLLVGSPQIVPDAMPIAWGAGVVTIESVSGDALKMANVSSATGRSPSGMALNRVTQFTTGAPVLMTTAASSNESDSGVDLQAIAAAGLMTSPSLSATISLPVTRMHYLPLGAYVTPDWPDDSPLTGQVRIVSYDVDLAEQRMTATVIPAGGYRGRR